MHFVDSVNDSHDEYDVDIEFIQTLFEPTLNVAFVVAVAFLRV
jgi:hypothetical protein